MKGFGLALAFVLMVGALAGLSHAFSVADQTGNYTLAIGNTATTYTLTATVTFGNDVNTTNVSTVIFYLPHGLIPNTPSSCNATNGWVGANTTYSTCTINVTANTTGPANYSILYKLNTSAFTANAQVTGARPTHGWLGPLMPYAVVSCTTGCGTSIQTSSMARWGVHASANPRPYFTPGQGMTFGNNVTIQYWNQTDAYYVIQLPVMSFNSTSNRPEYQNNSFGDVMYFDKGGQMERPNYMRMYSYSLNFTFLDVSNTSTFSLYNPVNVSTSPCTLQTGDCPPETLMPLLTQSNTFFDPVTNETNSFTISVPSPNGYDIYVNGTLRSINFSNSNQTAYWGLNASFTGGMQQNQLGIFTIAVSNAEVAMSTNYTLYFTVLNQTDTGGGSMSSTSPIYVINQSINGWDPMTPPPFGENITISYIAWMRNALQNWTFYNASVRYFVPMNGTRRAPTNSSDFQTCNYDGGGNVSTNCTFNMTRNVNFSWWNSTGWDSTGVTNHSSCLLFSDSRPGEESGGNVTVCFTYFNLPLATSTFNNWNPNSTTSIVGLNFSADISFPVMDETAAPQGTAGQSNSYNVTFQASMQTNLNLTDKVPNIADAGCAGTTLTVDGSTMTCGTNYTIGSLTINSISQGSHSISISYTPTASSGSSSSGPGSGGGDSSYYVTTTPRPTPTPTPAPTPGPSIERKILDSSTGVVGNFGAAGATFDLTYEAGADGFYGDLSWRLPFDYSEYALGQVRITPSPARVVKGSVIAYWENVDLAPSQVFKATVTVNKPLEKTVLNLFTAPSLYAKPKPTVQTPSATLAPTPELKRTALQPDYMLIAVVILGILIAGYYFGVMRRKNR